MNATIQAQMEYRSKFGNNRYNIQIVDSDEAAANLTRKYPITPEGAVIEYETTDQDVYKEIIPSTCVFTIICETQADADFIKEVATSDAGRYGIRILRANDNAVPALTHWVGSILSDQITFADNFPQAIQITATDDLGYLNEVPYLDSNGDRFTGDMTIVQHLGNALKGLRTRWHYDYFIELFGLTIYSVELALGEDLIPSEFDDGIGSGTPQRLYEQTKISNLTFYTDDEEQGVMTCFQVIEQICRYFNASLFQSYNTPTTRIYLVPFGAYQKYASDASTLKGATYRSDSSLFTTTIVPAFSTLDATNDSSTKVRTAGGQFSFLQPYKKIQRILTADNAPAVINRGFSEDGEGNYTTIAFGDFVTNDFYNFSSDDVFRARFILRTDWGGDTLTDGTGNTLAETIYTASGGGGTMPEAFQIGRIAVRMSLQLINEDEDGASLGNNYYLKRGLDTGGEVPIYDTYLNFTDTPRYYTDLIPQDEVEWDNSGTPFSFWIISEPFDIGKSQVIQFNRDLILPALPIDTPSGIILRADVDLVGNDGTIKQNSGTSFVENYNTPIFRFIARPFDGFQSGTDRVYTATTTNNNSKTKEVGSQILGDSNVSGAIGVVRYRKSDGTYSPESTGFTSLMESTSTYPAIKLNVNEIGNFYGKYREIYNGTLIKSSEIDLLKIVSITHTEDGGTTTIKSKIQGLSVITGLEETNITLVEINRDEISTTTFTDFVPEDTNVINAPPSSDFSRSIVSTLGSNVAPTVTLTSDATTRNRSSQTGEVIATIDANGVMQEIADGSDGQILGTNGSGVYAFRTEVTSYVLASHSARAVMYFQDRYYYGSTLLGWDTDGSFSSSQTLNTSINDQYAHNGIVVPVAFNNISLRATVRNDSFAGDVEISICKGSRPNGSTANITLTELGTATASCSSGIDLHYNADFDASVSVAEGDLIFVFLKRLAGGTGTDYINFSYTVYAINR